MRCHLIEPGEPAASPLEDEEGARVQSRAGIGAAVRALLGASPRIRVGDPPVDAAVLVHGRGLPGAAAEGLREAPRLLDRVEPPGDRSTRGIERDEFAPRSRALGGGAREDEAVGYRRRDRDRRPGRSAEVRPPEHPTAPCVQREGGLGRVPEDRILRQREPVRAAVLDVEVPRPQPAPGFGVECIDVAVQVLDVDDAVRDERGGSRDPGEARACRVAEAPGKVQRTHVRGVDLRTACRARTCKVAVRSCPLAVAATRAAGGEYESGEQRKEGAHRSSLATLPSRKLGTVPWAT